MLIILHIWHTCRVCCVKLSIHYQCSRYCVTVGPLLGQWSGTRLGSESESQWDTKDSETQTRAHRPQTECRHRDRPKQAVKWHSKAICVLFWFWIFNTIFFAELFVQIVHKHSDQNTVCQWPTEERNMLNHMHLLLLTMLHFFCLWKVNFPNLR